MFNIRYMLFFYFGKISCQDILLHRGFVAELYVVWKWIAYLHRAVTRHGMLTLARWVLYPELLAKQQKRATHSSAARFCCFIL